MKLAIFAGLRNQVSEPAEPASTRRSKRAVIAVAFGAGVACAILFGGQIAHADGPRPGGGAPVTTTLSTSRVVSTQGGRTMLPLTSVNVTKVTASASGQGLTQAQCDVKARLINTILGWKQEAANNQNQYLAEAYDDVAEGEIDNAMDQGCIIIF